MKKWKWGICFILLVAWILFRATSNISTEDFTLKGYKYQIYPSIPKEKVTQEEVFGEMERIKNLQEEYLEKSLEDTFFDIENLKLLTDGKIETKKELERDVEKSLQKQKEREQQLAKREMIKDTLLDKVEIIYNQEQLEKIEKIEEEILESYIETAASFHISLEEFYSKILGYENLEDYKGKVLEIAKKETTWEALVDKIAKEEAIVVSEEEYEENLEILMEIYHTEIEEDVWKHISKEEIYRRVLEDRVYEFLEKNNYFWLPTW